MGDGLRAAAGMYRISTRRDSFYTTAVAIRRLRHREPRIQIVSIPAQQTQRSNCEPMDPITVIILTTLFAVATGGAVAVRRTRRARRRARLVEDLKTRRPVGDRRVSIFDVFWDLGASDFALEMMARDGLIPEDDHEDGIVLAHSQLEDVVSQHGNYREFLEDSLEAIQEFFDEHRRAGHRRRLPDLKAAARRVIPVGRRLESDEPSDLDPGQPPLSEPQGPPDAADAMRRRRLRTGDDRPGLRVERMQQDVDIDEIGDVNAMDILQSVIDGGLGDQLQKWWKTRGLRRRRGELDEALEELYDFYADIARRHPGFYEPLYDAYRRWRDEARRLRYTARRRPWGGRSYQLAADVLFEMAIDLAEKLSRRAYDTTHETIETIHDYAADDDVAMAGYLVYLNRHAFFAGRHPDYAELARKVDFATQKVREEIVRLRNDGVI